MPSNYPQQGCARSPVSSFGSQFKGMLRHQTGPRRQGCKMVRGPAALNPQGEVESTGLVLSD